MRGDTDKTAKRTGGRQETVRYDEMSREELQQELEPAILKNFAKFTHG